MFWLGRSKWNSFYPVTCSITDYTNKGLLNALKPVLFMVFNRQFSTWWLPWGNSTKTAPENCEKPGRAGVWTSHGISKPWRKYESDQLPNCSKNGLRGPSTAEKLWKIQLSTSSWWPKPRRDEPDGSIIPKRRKKKIRDRPIPRRKQLSSTSGGLNPDLNKTKRKFFETSKKFSFYFGASTVRTTLNFYSKRDYC